MANQSIRAAFERMWQHITIALNDKLDKTGVLPIGNGGTNATTAANARTNLGFSYGTAAPSGTPSTGNGAVYFMQDDGSPMAISEGGTGAITAEAALANLGAAQVKVLWENADPTSAFAAQEITMNDTADFYIFIFRNYADSSYNTDRAVICIKGLVLYSFSSANTTSNNFYSRQATISGNIVDFDDCYRKAMSSTSAGTTKYNAYFIPSIIYGVKGVVK